MTRLVRTREELAEARAALTGTVGLVPTMGALHIGHEANIAASKAKTDSTVVSIFVNPMQFNQAADFDRYPRTLEADLEICERAGVDLVWHPEVDTMYRGGPAGVWLTAGALADQLEGPNRPGHFDGVLTVVIKLFNAVRPDLAFFGEKDYQQLALIRRMVLDLDLPVGIEGVPTIRDPDGLALSSRNVFLNKDDRAQAVRLNQALVAAGQQAGTVEQALRAARAHLAGIDVEYLEIRSPELAEPTTGPARILIAAKIGTVRLIDNMPIELGKTP